MIKQNESGTRQYWLSDIAYNFLCIWLFWASPKCLYLTEMPVSVLIKSWNGCKFPENSLLPILLYTSIWAKFPKIRTFPEDWHLWISKFNFDGGFQQNIALKPTMQWNQSSKTCLITSHSDTISKKWWIYQLLGTSE